MRIRVPGLIVWGACITAEPEMLHRTIRVLRYCAKVFETDRKPVLFSPLFEADPAIDRFWIPKMEMNLLSIFCNLGAPRGLLETGAEYALAVHEDGFPINPSMWSDEFLEYDYIGAPWDPAQCGGWPLGSGWGTELLVGNGGFCLQSARMLKLCLQMPLTAEIHSTASDVYVCRLQRKWFEEAGAKFAPPEVALRFATEQTNQDSNSFGFHGRSVATQKYQRGWDLIAHSEKQ
jgi:hypothetical protein